jgi:hypothetical protein
LLIAIRTSFSASHAPGGISGVANLPGSEPNLPQTALSEKPKQIAQQQNHQHCAKPYACSPSGAPPAVTVISSAPGEYEHQKNDDYDEHL